MVLLAGCATARQKRVEIPPVSIQSLQYYRFQVKGYQRSFPPKRIVVITPVDLRDFKRAGGVAHDPYQGQPAIGVILDRQGQIDQKLYGQDLPPLFRDAIAQSADEAGLVSTTSTDSLKQALKARNSDYVLASKITGLWVVKRRGADNQAGPTWFTSAQVTLDLAIYKPPFDIPFWQGTADAEFSDPAIAAPGASPEDEMEIYDQPGEVLSVALTRAVASIFRHDDLHTLVLEDTISAH